MRLTLNIMHELKARQTFIDNQLNAAFSAFYAGFLTEKEMEDVIDGTDMWMGVEEINKRWANHIAYQEVIAEQENE